MPSTSTDRLQGLTTSVAVKPPVKAVTSANITLAGLQTVGAVALIADDRVLVKDQTDATENGIYIASTSDWTRAKDFDGNRDAVTGTLIVTDGVSTATLFYRLITADPVIIGTSAITFVQASEVQNPYPHTPAEIAAGVTPVDYAYPAANARRYGAPIDGLTSANSAIHMADLVAVEGGGLPILPTGIYLINDDLTIIAGLQVMPGAIISIAATKTLTFSNHSHFVASESSRCISGTGLLNFGYDTVAQVYAAWFGCGHEFNGIQNKAALLAAMNSLTNGGQVRGGTVVLPSTGFSCNGDIVPPAGGLRLLGQGWSSGYNDTGNLGTLITAVTGTCLLDLTADFGDGAPNEYFMAEGIRFDGNDLIAYGAIVEGTKHFRGCIFTKFTTAGMWWKQLINQSSAEYCTFISNAPTTGGRGMIVEGTLTTKFAIKGCNFRLNNVGLELKAGLNFTLQDNVYESNTGRGLSEHNADGSSLGFGLHINEWFENNNSIDDTRFQYALFTDATSLSWYPQGMVWINGSINGSSVAGQRAADINANCFDTRFVGTRFGGEVGDTSAISVAANTRTIFDDCFDVTTFGSASAANFRQRTHTGAAIANSNAPSGNTSKAIPIYDTDGTFLGYIPCYALQW